jgi:putative ABC transport system ATP-binding protein
MSQAMDHYCKYLITACNKNRGSEAKATMQQLLTGKTRLPGFGGEWEVKRLDELAEIRNKEIGFIFQTFNLLPRSTALDNVILPLIYTGMKKQERQSKALSVLKEVGLADRVLHKPNELSGGQRQRVAIARALVNSPSILLADEPTGNLDSKTSTEIMGLLHEIHQQGNTIIIVTHEEEIAMHAHRIIRLRDGIIESDQTNETIHIYQKA